MGRMERCRRIEECFEITLGHPWPQWVVCVEATDQRKRAFVDLEGGFNADVREQMVSLQTTGPFMS